MRKRGARWHMAHGNGTKFNRGASSAVGIAKGEEMSKRIAEQLLVSAAQSGDTSAFDEQVR